MARPSGRDIRSEVLREAGSAVQRAGVASLSYGTLAERLGVRAPSIHHHFRRKRDLVRAVTDAYCHDFDARVRSIDGPDGPSSPSDRLRAYATLFDEVAAEGRLCLCGAVAADWPTVDDDSRRIVAAFFDRQRMWLADQLTAAADAGELAARSDPTELADLLLNGLEGTLLLARTDGIAADPDGADPSGATTGARRLVDTVLALARPI